MFLLKFNFLNKFLNRVVYYNITVSQLFLQVRQHEQIEWTVHMLAQIQKATGQLLRQASSFLPVAAPFSFSCTPTRAFSTEFVFDEENFRAPDLPHGLEVH